MEIFTPLNEERTIRGRFEASDVKVLSGDLSLRKRGKKATVLIHGRTYDVIGIACGLPHCVCDAYLREVKDADMNAPHPMTEWPDEHNGINPCRHLDYNEYFNRCPDCGAADLLPEVEE